MDVKVKNALTEGVESYAILEGINGTELLIGLEEVFDSEAPFMDKVAQLDEVFDTNMRFDELREVCFDLLMINFFAEDIQKLEEDYLDSDEWESIEEETLDRGTELLNIFLYLRECADEDVQPSLDDYLKEFLLVEEDEFQDEYRIYERIIANQILAESDYSEIAKVAKTVTEEEELYDLFYPMVSFFYESSPNTDQEDIYASNALNTSFDVAVYKLIVNFNN